MPYAPIPILLLLLYGTFLLAVRSGLRRQLQTFSYHCQWKGDISAVVEVTINAKTVLRYSPHDF